MDLGAVQEEEWEKTISNKENIPISMMIQQSINHAGNIIVEDSEDHIEADSMMIMSHLVDLEEVLEGEVLEIEETEDKEWEIVINLEAEEMIETTQVKINLPIIIMKD